MKQTYRPSSLQGRVFTRQMALKAGLTDHQLAGPGWHRLVRGVYADSRMPLDHALRTSGARFVLPAHAILGGPSAAWLQGAKLAPVWEPVHVLVTRMQRFGPIQGITIHSTFDPLGNGDIGFLGDTMITKPLRTAWDIGCWLPLKDSLPYLDAMLASGAFSRAQLQQAAAVRPPLRYSKRARRAFLLADGSAGSPAESGLRGVIVDSGLPEPIPQYEIWCDGVFVARVDFAWPDSRVALEYEGAYHAGVDQMVKDRRRLNRIAEAGWQVLFATKEHVYGNKFPQLRRQIQSAL